MQHIKATDYFQPKPECLPFEPLVDTTSAEEWTEGLYPSFAERKQSLADDKETIPSSCNSKCASKVIWHHIVVYVQLWCAGISMLDETQRVASLE